MFFTGSTPRSSWRSWIMLLTAMMLTSIALLSMLTIGHTFGLDTSFGKTGSEMISNVSQYSASSGSVDVNWYAPAQSMINSVESVINSTGIYGFIFDSSTTSTDVPYNTYNWCNMPHVRAQEYRVPSSDYELQYVEVIHRHHKRTPYASNTFPIERHSWSCSNSHLYYYATTDPQNTAAQITWQITPPSLPIFSYPQINIGFPDSTCQFPQITSEGLQDSFQHGSDLRSVYIDHLHFLPETYEADLVTIRVTNNVITSQVASQVILALYPDSLTNTSVPVTVQPSTLDSLEPTYSCPAAAALYSSYSVGSNNTAWLAHLEDTSTVSLFETLDDLSGVDANDPAWHSWVDHYFDNLSAKLCHGKPLGCKTDSSTHDFDPETCISREMADDIFRRGLYEYSYIYRDDPQSLTAARGSFGVWLAELAQHIRTAIDAYSESESQVHSRADETGMLDDANFTGPNISTDRKKTKDELVKYRHNIAHDGSISRLLSLLQVDIMVWPGMGSEVIFELYRKRSTGCRYVRILWMGEVLRSSSPMLQSIEGEEAGMIEVERFLGYVDGLVGRGGVDLMGLCYGGDG